MTLKMNQSVAHEFLFLSVLYNFFKNFLFIRGEGKEKERERNTDVLERYMDWLPLSHSQLGAWPATQVCALAGN